MPRSCVGAPVGILKGALHLPWGWASAPEEPHVPVQAQASEGGGRAAQLAWGGGRRRAAGCWSSGHAGAEGLGRQWGPSPPLQGRPAGAQLGPLFIWGGQGEAGGGWRRPSPGEFQV